MVLKLGWGTQSTAYVTWAGGSSRGDTKEKLEMDNVYGKRLGIPAELGAKVTVEYVANASTCTAASVEPADFDDWEILEANAGAVESKLLRQARVVAPGQPIVFWLDASASVCLTPSQITPDPTHGCAVLDNNTEIVVAPKVRAHANAERHLMAAEEPSADRRQARIHCLRVAALAPADGVAEFGTLYAAAGSTIAKDTDKKEVVRVGRATADNSTKDSSDTALAPPPWMGRLSVSSTVQPGVLCATAATLLAAGLASGQLVRAQMVSSPAQSPATLTVCGIGQNIAPEAVRKVLTAILDTQPAIVLNIGACIPASAAHDSRPMARVVEYTVGGSGAASVERPHETPLRIDSRSLPGLQIECEGQQAPDISEDEQVELAGVDAFLETAWASVLGALATGGSSGGVLLCGRRGSGKTSIARHVMKRAAAYRGRLVYCRHINCATLGMDGRAGSVREAVRAIVEDALTHHPALLVLDDLDALAPAETEQGDARRLRRIVDALVSGIDPRDGRRVVVVATAAGRSHVHGRLFDAAIVAD
ncbi:Peroxisome biosynthesis protein pex1, partial [Coemansia erecta]